MPGRLCSEQICAECVLFLLGLREVLVASLSLLLMVQIHSSWPNVEIAKPKSWLKKEGQKRAYRTDSVVEGDGLVQGCW